jgi:hypothetical protein
MAHHATPEQPSINAEARFLVFVGLCPARDLRCWLTECKSGEIPNEHPYKGKRS